MAGASGIFGYCAMAFLGVENVCFFYLNCKLLRNRTLSFCVSRLQKETLSNQPNVADLQVIWNEVSHHPTELKQKLKFFIRFLLFWDVLPLNFRVFLKKVFALLYGNLTEFRINAKGC